MKAVSEAESKVLEVLWRHGGRMTADEVVAAMGKKCRWSAGTIRTFLRRLMVKGALAATPDGRRYLYQANVSRDDYVHQQSRSLIDRLFGGGIAPFIAHFSERSDLSREDVEELRRLIERLDHDR
jgi:BlaI family penicillinase repressor